MDTYGSSVIAVFLARISPVASWPGATFMWVCMRSLKTQHISCTLSIWDGLFIIRCIWWHHTSCMEIFNVVVLGFFTPLGVTISISETTEWLQLNYKMSPQPTSTKRWVANGRKFNFGWTIPSSILSEVPLGLCESKEDIFSCLLNIKA